MWQNTLHKNIHKNKIQTKDVVRNLLLVFFKFNSISSFEIIRQILPTCLYNRTFLLFVILHTILHYNLKEKYSFEF